MSINEDLIADVGQELMDHMEDRGLTIPEILLVLASLNAIVATGYEVGTREIYGEKGGGSMSVPMGVPLRIGTCGGCGVRTYEEEGYGCPCRNVCPECGEFYPEGPHKECYDHWGAMDEDTKVDMFTELLQERNEWKEACREATRKYQASREEVRDLKAKLAGQALSFLEFLKEMEKLEEMRRRLRDS